MISRVCDAGLASSVEDAQNQDLELCKDILIMRYYSYVREEYRRDNKTLTPEREKFLEQMERISQET